MAAFNYAAQGGEFGAGNLYDGFGGFGAGVWSMSAPPSGGPSFLAGPQPPPYGSGGPMTTTSMTFPPTAPMYQTQQMRPPSQLPPAVGVGLPPSQLPPPIGVGPPPPTMGRPPPNTGRPPPNYLGPPPQHRRHGFGCC
mmetsp:Transcript_41482/g.75161  ORF Transcript_41482/g.75161 Transcript_41482/m.75161 type:complete len:138 (-) Transcript_41482:91-504(-)